MHHLLQFGRRLNSDNVTNTAEKNETGVGLSMKKQVTIIGAGASGMTAAIFAARQGAQVTLLEHMDRVGKKILSTGNGKCNLSNRFMEETCYRSGVADFPMEVISRFTVEETLSFFEDLGIVVKDRNGYLYPHSGQASSVLDVLRAELDHRRIRTVTECRIDAVRYRETGDKRFKVSTSQGSFLSDCLILATGSKAAPATGSDGSGYQLAEQLGHHIIKPLPALVQLRCREKFYKQISGVRTDGCVSLRCGSEELARDQGEIQLTDYGISGIPVFQVSRYASRAIDRGEKVTAVLDFYPDATFEKTRRMMEGRKLSCSSKPMEEFFTGWFHKKLAALFIRLANLEPHKQAGLLTVEEIDRLTCVIKEFTTEITAANPFENAQICCGGADVREIAPESMESKLKKGLYLIGELLDVDGICGGYNLQWAWSTGAIAGTHAGL